MAQFFRFIHPAVLNHLIVLSSFSDYRSYHNWFELHLTLIFVLSFPLALVLVLRVGFDGSFRPDGSPIWGCWSTFEELGWNISLSSNPQYCFSIWNLQVSSGNLGSVWQADYKKVLSCCHVERRGFEASAEGISRCVWLVSQRVYVSICSFICEWDVDSLWQTGCLNHWSVTHNRLLQWCTHTWNAL